MSIFVISLNADSILRIYLLYHDEINKEKKIK